VNLVLSAVFLILSMAQAKYGIADALVLGVIAVTYFRGWQTKNESYAYVATILSLAFASLEILAALAGYANEMISGEVAELNITPAMLGILLFPVIKMKRWI
jgi:hypothetical protein